MDTSISSQKPIARKKILVVDDDPDLREIIQGGLAGQGYEVFTAADGFEGFKKVEAHAPDLIVADLIMPNFNGWKLAQKLKKDPRFQKIPIILLSGMINDEGGDGECEWGDFQLPKPFEFEKLLAKIKELI